MPVGKFDLKFYANLKISKPYVSVKAKSLKLLLFYFPLFKSFEIVTISINSRMYFF